MKKEKHVLYKRLKNFLIYYNGEKSVVKLVNDYGGTVKYKSTKGTDSKSDTLYWIETDGELNCGYAEEFLNDERSVISVEEAFAIMEGGSCPAKQVEYEESSKTLYQAVQDLAAAADEMIEALQEFKKSLI